MQTTEDRFWAFHEKHPEVYRELLALCRRWIAAGGEHWSIWAAFAVARWERRFAGLPDEDERWKLSNNYTGFYARLLMDENPELRGLFTLRPMREGGARIR